ncbi:hypothetical protein EDD16DRAFT_1528348 [Pisolithus croceorrhizus]|nr:hypothetical protein EDD16DRAFT_1528348 [Pisolithus croceorrhizus]KAI6152697.1 hypothetical protein EDD17DRAFT_1513266 [Pisolithus thermaeus]
MAAFFKKEVKESHLELTKLRIAKKRAEKALYRAQAMQEDLKVTIQQITMAWDTVARCNICKGCADQQLMSHTSLREQINTDLTIIPEYLREYPVTAGLYNRGYLDIALYGCPVCKEPVQMKPTEVNNFSDFFEVVNNILG